MEEENKLIFEYLINGKDFVKKVLCLKDKEGNIVDLAPILSEIKSSIDKSFPKAGDPSYRKDIPPLFFFSSGVARMLSPRNSGSVVDILNIMLGITLAARLEEDGLELVVMPDREITLDDVSELEMRAIARLNQFDSNLTRIMDHAVASITYELGEPINHIRRSLEEREEAKADND